MHRITERNVAFSGGRVEETAGPRGSRPSRDVPRLLTAAEERDAAVEQPVLGEARVGADAFPVHADGAAREKLPV